MPLEWCLREPFSRHVQEVLGAHLHIPKRRSWMNSFLVFFFVDSFFLSSFCSFLLRGKQNVPIHRVTAKVLVFLLRLLTEGTPTKGCITLRDRTDMIESRSIMNTMYICI